MIQIEILDQGLGCLVENLAAVNAEVVVMPVREGEDFDRVETFRTGERKLLRR